MNKEANALNEYMANIFVETNNLYNMHFNIKGESFFGLHKKLQEYYEKFEIFYDLIAERIKMFESYPITNIVKLEEISSIKSMQNIDYSGKQVLEVLQNDFNYLKDYSKDLIEYFEKLKDFYTIDLLTEILKVLEKELWMINSSLK